MNWRVGIVEYPANALLKGGSGCRQKLLGVGCRGRRPNLDTGCIDDIAPCYTGGVYSRRRSISIPGWWVFGWGQFGRRKGTFW